MGAGAGTLSRRPLSVALLTSAAAWRGSGVSFANIAHALVERGHRPHLLAGAADVVDAFGRLGLPVTQVPTDNTGLREILALRRTLDAIAADVLLVDRPRDLRLAALASLGRRFAIINRYNLSRANPPSDLVSRLAYRRVRLTVFVSQSLARRVLALAPYLHQAPRRVIQEGVDADRFRPDPAGAAAFRSARGLGDRPFVLAVGSLIAEKRHDFLLDAVASLGASAPPLLIAGSGPLADTLRRQADARGIDARFLGLLRSAELPGAYTAATCFVHACAVETFGLSVLEAMACGAPVLGVRGGGVTEVLGDAGVLAPSHDIGTFAGLLAAILADPGRRQRLGASARTRAVEQFSLQRMGAAYAEVIESVG